MKTKKLFAFLLAVLLVLAALPSVSAAEVIASGICGQVNEAYIQWDNDGDNVTWTLTDDGVLTVSGTGKMNGYFGGYGPVAGPWRDYRDQITTVVVNDGVTNVGAGAFDRCKNLTTVILADSVKSVGYMAFSGSNNLSSLTIVDGAVVGQDAFSPDHLPAQGDFIIVAKTNLIGYVGAGGDVVVPDGITHVLDDAFVLPALTFSEITSVTFPDSVESIGLQQFGEGFSSLKSVTFGNGLTTLPRGTFNGCSVLSSVVLPEGMTTIEEHAVVNCASLTNVTVPRSVTTIGNHALGYNCNLGYAYNGRDPYSEKMTNFKITGYTGTAAETYAKENGFAFIALDEPEPEETQPTTPVEPEETEPTTPTVPEDTQPSAPSVPEETQPSAPTIGPDALTYPTPAPADNRTPQSAVTPETPAAANPLSVATGSEAAPAAALMLLGVLAVLACGAIAAGRRKE